MKRGMRVSLSEKQGEIRGVIGWDGDAMFAMECAALILEQISKKSGVPLDEVVRDLHSIAAGKVKDT